MDLMSTRRHKTLTKPNFSFMCVHFQYFLSFCFLYLFCFFVLLVFVCSFPFYRYVSTRRLHTSFCFKPKLKDLFAETAKLIFEPEHKVWSNKDSKLLWSYRIVVSVFVWLCSEWRLRFIFPAKWMCGQCQPKYWRLFCLLLLTDAIHWTENYICVCVWVCM